MISAGKKIHRLDSIKLHKYFSKEIYGRPNSINQSFIENKV